MLTDIEIAQSSKMLDIRKIAEMLGICDEEISLYGKYKAKLSDSLLKRLKDRPDGKLILVTAINPTPAGEGKTTTTVGLGQAMGKIGKRAVIALREPSLGPVFGIKGGAAGGGYAQVVPMEDINLHFTGDLHAISSANNLLCAMVDNHIQQGNPLNIDPRKIVFKRTMDMNDRVLRDIIVGLGGRPNGVVREDGFCITAACEVMAVLCLAKDLSDLKKMLGNILVGYTYDDKPVYARQIKAEGAMAVLLKEAIDPNLIQTLENTPCIMHGGPFANIAHGCNSVRATKAGLKLADYCITEAGFGADLGAEKFFDIKCRKAGLYPDAVVLVATIRALKYNGGVKKENLREENLEALALGIPNLKKHIENIKKYGITPIVALNRFETDTDAEIKSVSEACDQMGVGVSLSEVFAKGGEGASELAKMVCEAADSGKNSFHTLYADELSISDKIEIIAKEIYGADSVKFDMSALSSMKKLTELGYASYPVCIAKTQYSLSDNPTLLGRPERFTINIREVRVSSGAGFILCMAGDIMTMPGLPRVPSAENIDIDSDGKITGLF